MKRIYIIICIIFAFAAFLNAAPDSYADGWGSCTVGENYDSRVYTSTNYVTRCCVSHPVCLATYGGNGCSCTVNSVKYEGSCWSCGNPGDCSQYAYGTTNTTYYYCAGTSCAGDSYGSASSAIENCAPAYQDIGLRIFDGSQTISVAIENTLSSPLRIAKDGEVYGIVLVDTGDPQASKIRIKTSSGIKAVRKLE